MKKETLPFVRTQTDLEGFVLKEVGDGGKPRFPYMRYLKQTNKNPNQKQTQRTNLLAEGRGWGMGQAGEGAEELESPF